MSKSKIVAMVALIAFAMGIFLVDDALAGERHKTRSVTHNVKWNPINVPDEQGHVIASLENKGIVTNLEGKAFCDGWLVEFQALWESNPKMDIGAGYGYWGGTDRDGDKVYARWEAKKVKGDPHSRGTLTIIKGTGKWEGIQGRHTFVGTVVAPGEQYADQDWDIELPRR
jgi:hypothetical protein